MDAEFDGEPWFGKSGSREVGKSGTPGVMDEASIGRENVRKLVGTCIRFAQGRGSSDSRPSSMTIGSLMSNPSFRVRGNVMPHAVMKPTRDRGEPSAV